MAAMEKLGGVFRATAGSSAALVYRIRRAAALRGGELSAGRLPHLRPRDSGSAEIAAGSEPRTMVAHPDVSPRVTFVESLELRRARAVRSVAATGLQRRNANCRFLSPGA